MRHVPCAGAIWRLPFAGGGRLVAVAKSRMPARYYGVVVPGESEVRPAVLACHHAGQARNASPDDNGGGRKRCRSTGKIKHRPRGLTDLIRPLLTEIKPGPNLKETPMRDLLRPIAGVLSIACLATGLTVLSTGCALAQDRQAPPSQMAPAQPRPAPPMMRNSNICISTAIVKSSYG